MKIYSENSSNKANQPVPSRVPNTIVNPMANIANDAIQQLQENQQSSTSDHSLNVHRYDSNTINNPLSLGTARGEEFRQEPYIFYRTFYFSRTRE